jgi:hypothetical protein
LQVIGHAFVHTKIFHIGRHLRFQLNGHPEKIINGVARVEDNGGIIKLVYFFFAQFLGGYRVYLYKGPEINFEMVFGCQIEKRRFIAVCRAGLRNQDALYFQWISAALLYNQFENS